MAEQNKTSPEVGLTPTPGTPLTGTSASDGLTPQKPALTHEDALKSNAQLEHELKLAREAEERLGKKLAAHEKAQKEREAAEQAAKDADLSELERLKKQYAQDQQQDQQVIERYKRELIDARIQLAAHAKGITNTRLAALAVQDPKLECPLEFGDDGLPANLDKALESAIKVHNLAPKVESPVDQSSASPMQQIPPVTPPMNAPSRQGLAVFPSPTQGGLAPNQVTRLTDPSIWKK